MASMTRRVGPRPKLRVTSRSWIPSRPQKARFWLGEIGGDDDEFSGGANFDDGFGWQLPEREAADDTLDFAGLAVALAFDDVAREDNVFEVEDREVVIVKLLRQ